MKKVRIKPFLVTILIWLFLFISSQQLFAEERNIYVGDLINLKVSSQEFTKSELQDKFKDFEIVNITENDEGFLVTLCTFETGEKTIQLGNKEIKISVKSTLNEIERNEIYEGDLSPEKASFSINWLVVFCILLAVFLVTGGVTLWKFIKNRKRIALSPYERFIEQTNKCVLDDEEYFVKLTLNLKEYLEAKYSFSIRGKTSAEIIEEIKFVSALMPRISMIRSWLEESDYYKFSGVATTINRKQELLDELLEIVRKIEEAKEEEV